MPCGQQAQGSAGRGRHASEGHLSNGGSRDIRPIVVSSDIAGGSTRCPASSAVILLAQPDETTPCSTPLGERGHRVRLTVQDGRRSSCCAPRSARLPRDRIDAQLSEIQRASTAQIHIVRRRCHPFFKNRPSEIPHQPQPHNLLLGSSQPSHARKWPSQFPALHAGCHV